MPEARLGRNPLAGQRQGPPNRLPHGHCALQESSEGQQRDVPTAPGSSIRRSAPAWRSGRRCPWPSPVRRASGYGSSPRVGEARAPLPRLHLRLPPQQAYRSAGLARAPDLYMISGCASCGGGTSGPPRCPCGGRWSGTGKRSRCGRKYTHSAVGAPLAAVVLAISPTFDRTGLLISREPPGRMQIGVVVAVAGELVQGGRTCALLASRYGFADLAVCSRAFKAAGQGKRLHGPAAKHPSRRRPVPVSSVNEGPCGWRRRGG